MNMDRVIVYGLGSVYRENSERINNSFDVIGYCDKDSSKLSNMKGIPIERLKDYIATIDYVLVVPIKYSADIRKMLNKFGVPNIKIRNFFETHQGKYIWKEMPVLGNTYSGDFEDIIIDNILRNNGKDISSIHYIELGTCNPIMGNNTYHFYEKGASGILVEANPYVIETIRMYRERDIVLHRAVYKESGINVSFFISSELGLSSLDKNHVEENPDWQKKYKIEEEVLVPSIDVNDVFEMLKDECDLLAIDLEGYDLETLESIDYNKYRPKIIVAELNYTYVKKQAYYQRIVDFLINNSYVLYAANKYNGIFVLSDLIDNYKRSVVK